MVKRLIKHIFPSFFSCRKLFSKEEIELLNQGIVEAEKITSAEFKIVLENGIRALNLPTPNVRANELFSIYRVWDTEKNNGVLIYVELVDRAIEILTDRGIRCATLDLEKAVQLIKDGFTNKTPGAGMKSALLLLAEKLKEDFPAEGNINEVCDRVELL